MSEPLIVGGIILAGLALRKKATDKSSSTTETTTTTGTKITQPTVTSSLKVTGTTVTEVKEVTTGVEVVPQAILDARARKLAEIEQMIAWIEDHVANTAVQATFERLWDERATRAHVLSLSTDSPAIVEAAEELRPLISKATQRYNGTLVDGFSSDPVPVPDLVSPLILDSKSHREAVNVLSIIGWSEVQAGSNAPPWKQAFVPQGVYRESDGTYFILMHILATADRVLVSVSQPPDGIEFVCGDGQGVDQVGVGSSFSMRFPVAYDNRDGDAPVAMSNSTTVPTAGVFDGRTTIFPRKTAQVAKDVFVINQGGIKPPGLTLYSRGRASFAAGWRDPNYEAPFPFSNGSRKYRGRWRYSYGDHLNTVGVGTRITGTKFASHVNLIAKEGFICFDGLKQGSATSLTGPYRHAHLRLRYANSPLGVKARVVGYNKTNSAPVRTYNPPPSSIFNRN